MKYRRKNAEVEAVQFTVKTEVYEKIVLHNAADVALKTANVTVREDADGSGFCRR